MVYALYLMSNKQKTQIQIYLKYTLYEALETEISTITNLSASSRMPVR